MLPSRETVRIIQSLVLHYFLVSFLLSWDLLLTFLCICIVLASPGTDLLSLALCMQAQITADNHLDHLQVSQKSRGR